MLKNNRIIAFTGPSGAGKTTLGNLLAARHGAAIPRHCTTRVQRKDDIPGFYRYLSHDDYNCLFQSNEFLISSGDGPYVDKVFGNFYGVLYGDCFEVNYIYDIILFVSYKDILSLINLKSTFDELSIVNISFRDLEKGVFDRLSMLTERQHTHEDIAKRVKCAIDDYKTYYKVVNQFATANIFTDESTVEESYNDLYRKLRL